VTLIEGTRVHDDDEFLRKNAKAVPISVACLAFLKAGRPC
jgi:hypothetical protein